MNYIEYNPVRPIEFENYVSAVAKGQRIKLIRVCAIIVIIGIAGYLACTYYTNLYKSEKDKLANNKKSRLT